MPFTTTHRGALRRFARAFVLATCLGGRIMGGVTTGLAVGAGVVAAEAIGRNFMGRQAAGTPTDDNINNRIEPSFNRNADMGGQDFGMADAGGWDDGSSLDMGSSDWDT